MFSIGFHTPELPERLNLNLANLSGGGFAPSQFYGETLDGCDVYVRYRGGWLRVHMADRPGADALSDGTCILETVVGPPFDGAMSLTQFCTHFGVTINGSIPAETDPGADRYTDFSGQTTYWSAHLSQITIETARNIVAQACSVFPQALLVKPVLTKTGEYQFQFEGLEQTTPARIDTTQVWLMDGPASVSDIETHPKDWIVSRSDQLQISGHFMSWQYPDPKYTSLVSRSNDELGRPAFVPGERDMPKELELTTDSLMLKTSFPRADKATRAGLDSLGKAIRDQVPVTKLHRVNLETGDILGQTERPLDPVITEWCKSGPDRWVSVTRDKRDGPFIGVGPA